MIRLRSLSRAELRQLDIQAAELSALPTSLLMENAGRGAAGWLAELVGATSLSSGGHPRSFSPYAHTHDIPLGQVLPKVLILCGPGNNGGDGGVVARHLNAWGFSVRVIWITRSDQLRGDAALQWAILQKSKVEQSAWFDRIPLRLRIQRYSARRNLGRADWLVDGLLGTGLSRPVGGLLHTVIKAMNRSGKPIFALDVPSGLDADAGVPLGVAIRAVATATFVAAKLGFAAPGAVDYTGEVAVFDIGLPRCLIEPFFEP